MSLSGQLEIFPLEEVLRLMARARQNGCLRVDGPGAGRIYMDSGSLTYASVEGDDAIREHLVASRLATDEALRQLDVSRGSLADALSPSSAGSALTELIREQCVEAVYRIRRPGEGHFEFLIDAQPRYVTGQAFDIETIISESERRAAEWADIEIVVPDLENPWRMVPEIDEDSVNLSDTAWRFLAAMDGSCSVQELASRLGLTTFQTARRMAELSRARLVEPTPVASASTRPDSVVSEHPDEPSYPEPVAEEFPAPGTAEHDRSWWLDENQEAAPTAEAGEEEEARAAGDEEPSPVPVAEDQEESFLETVFGELEKTEEEPPESDDDDDDGGFGLLRRRGLGAAFRELADG